MPNIFQDIKDRVDLRDLVRFYGLDLNRGGFACCPFHNERTPSFKVYEDHFHCFGCGEHGDHVDFVQKLRHLLLIHYDETQRLHSRYGGNYFPGSRGRQAASERESKASPLVPCL